MMFWRRLLRREFDFEACFHGVGEVAAVVCRYNVGAVDCAARLSVRAGWHNTFL